MEVIGNPFSHGNFILGLLLLNSQELLRVVRCSEVSTAFAPLYVQAFLRCFGYEAEGAKDLLMALASSKELEEPFATFAHCTLCKHVQAQLLFCICRSFFCKVAMRFPVMHGQRYNEHSGPS